MVKWRCSADGKVEVEMEVTVVFGGDGRGGSNGGYEVEMVVEMQ